MQRREEFSAEFGLGSSRAWEGHIRSEGPHGDVPYHVFSYPSRRKHRQEVEGRLKKWQDAFWDKGRARIEFGERTVEIWCLTSLGLFGQECYVSPQDLFRQDEMIDHCANRPVIGCRHVVELCR